MLSASRLTAAFERARSALLNECGPEGHWVGELASSSLSTATAVSALAFVARNDDRACAADRRLIEQGIGYLVAHQNADGGWGDTDRSFSNVATTMLCVAAFHAAQVADAHRSLLDQAERYIDGQGRVAALRRRYGKDKTFAVPILTNCALAGLVPWQEVSALPFELACLPQSWYRLARMPVVSYAIPALVAIGQAKYWHQPPRFPLLRWIRRASVGRSLTVLRRMQPASGGYLEAVPLTSFVVMSLAATGRADHAVTESGAQFLRSSVRTDGSWPIDTNLATWNTTLAINALAASGEDVTQLQCLDWLLSCQHRIRHPFTGAAPGGWGWSDLSGAVPDADDTAGALLALSAWHHAPAATVRDRAAIEQSAQLGVRWLLDLQNADGGWPTFCRGWGKLPFDRSGADLTAHALRALRAWQNTVTRANITPHVSQRRLQKGIARGFRYLQRQQRADGSWVPLWFGNQHHPDELNPVYGTTKVLLGFHDFGQMGRAAMRGIDWLMSNQHSDGGWGAGARSNYPYSSSLEETSLAIEALCAAGPSDDLAEPFERGLEWLMNRLEDSDWFQPSPIGFYFAKLWYYEKLYPLTFAVAALGRAMRVLNVTSGDRGQTANNR